jgi:5'-3' exonuclease
MSSIGAGYLCGRCWQDRVVPDRLMLLDAASMYFRAFYGVPESLKAPDGTPVNAVRGFLDMVATLVTRRRPQRLVACWDDDWRPAFRVQALPSYKAHRVADPAAGTEETPGALEPQVPVIAAVLAAFGIARVGAAGLEADDVAGTLATRAVAAGPADVDVVTGDRDLFQLVDDAAGVRVLYIGRGVRNLEIVDEARLHEKYGVRGGPGYADVAALRGDPSDGLPGVARESGEKTAAALINRYGTLEKLLAALDAGEPDLAKGPGRRLLAARDYLAAAPSSCAWSGTPRCPRWTTGCPRPRSTPTRSSPSPTGGASSRASAGSSRRSRHVHPLSVPLVVGRGQTTDEYADDAAPDAVDRVLGRPPQRGAALGLPRGPCSIWPNRSTTCLHQRTKSPAARSASSRTLSSRAPEAHRWTAQARPRSGSGVTSRAWACSASSRADQILIVSSREWRTAPGGMRGLSRPSSRRGLVDDGAGAGGEPGAVEPGPHALAQALGDQQVGLGVDALETPARRRDGVPREVPALGEQVADAVEDPRDRVRAALDAARQLLGLAVQAPPALRPPRVVLAVGAAVAGMRPQPAAQAGELLVVAGVRPAARRPHLVVVGRRAERVAQRRGQVAARGGVA